MVMAVSPAMLTDAFPSHERGRALGYNAMVVALGTSAGPALGGLITGHLSWHWIFFINAPLGLVGLVVAITVLTERRPGDGRGNPAAVAGLRGRFDIPGAILLGLGFGALTLGLSFGREWGWTSPLLVATLVVAITALGALGLVERRVKSPIVDVTLFRSRVFSSAILSLVLSFLALFAVSFLMPFYFEDLRHFSTQKSGLLLIALPLAIAVTAPFSGRLADRVGTRWLAASGLTIACLGLVLLAGLDARSSVFDIVWRLAFTGAGQALFQSPNNSALLGAAPASQRGVASGILSTGRVMGQSVSVALAGAVFAALGGALAANKLSTDTHPSGSATLVLQHSFVTGYHAALLVCAALAAFGVGASLVRGREG